MFGWRIDPMPDTEISYWGIFNGETVNGGMMLLPDDAPALAHWLVYFGIDDLEAAARQIGEAGGVVVMRSSPRCPG